MRRRSLLLVAPGLAVGVMLLLASLALAAPFTLSGRVTDQTGTGLIGATVDALQPNTTTVVASTTSGSDGGYALVLDNGNYDLRVIPPPGSGFQTSVTHNLSVTADENVNVILVPVTPTPGQVRVSGRVLDRAGNGVAGQTVQINGPSAVTDASGHYSVVISEADTVGFTLRASGVGGTTLPATYQLSGSVTGNFRQDATLDLRVPTQRVRVQVRDPSGAPVAGASTDLRYLSISVSIPGFLNNPSSFPLTMTTSLGTIDATASTNNSGLPGGGGAIGATAQTDANGEATLWVFAAPSGGRGYDLNASPPSGSNLLSNNRSGITVSEDTTLVIALLPPVPEVRQVTVSGRVLDRAGNGVAGQTVQISSGSAVTDVTDASGHYSVVITEADTVGFTLRASGVVGTTLPATYQLSGSVTGNFRQDATLDLRVPTQRVRVQVQDPTGTPVADASTELRYLSFSFPGVPSNPSSFPLTMTTSFGTVEVTASANSSGIPGFGAVVGATAQTDASGEATLWVFAAPSGGRGYDLNASPPSGSNLLSNNRSGITVSEDTTLVIALLPPVPEVRQVTVSGRVLDRAGNGVAGQTVQISSGSAVTDVTDASGHYSVVITEADTVGFTLRASGVVGTTLPATYQLSGSVTGNFRQDATLDLRVPTQRVRVQVQDPFGTPVADASTELRYLSFSFPGVPSNPSSFPLTMTTSFGIVEVTASANSSGVPGFGAVVGATAQTDASGEATLWVFAAPSGGRGYDLSVGLPPDSPYQGAAASGISVTSDRLEIVLLQFVHAPPVTTASFSPQAVNGVYTSSPVIVTLSATAASGFTVASTKYTIDNGPEQTYTAPFPISGDGTHTLRYWSVDNLGVFESPKTATLQIQSSNPAPTISSLSPSSAQSGGAAFTLTVNGTGFVPTSKVHWNGSERPTTYGSATQLTASITAADIATPGTPKVTVVSPAPGGGTSNEATFTVTQGNRPPTANAGGPYNVPAGASVQLSGSGSDPDNDTVTFAWDLDNNGSFETPGQSPTFSAAGLTPGTSKTVVLQVCDSHNLCINSAPATINVVSTLQITTASPLPSGTVGQPYSVTLQAAGGQEPYRWSVASGNLPPGLSLNENTGVISGTPTNGGTYGFTVRVTDSSQVVATKSFTLSPPPTGGSSGTPYPPTPVQPTPPAPGDGSPPPACTNYVLAPGSDPLPPGMTLDPVTGLLSGTPTNGGTFRIVVQCTYNTNQTATADFTITINNPVPTLTALSPNTTTAGGAQLTLTLTGTQCVDGATVRWNTTTLEVLSRTATQITAKVTPAEIATVIPVSVTVVNPGPGGGPSNALPFTITQINRPPTANAGPDQTVKEGTTVQLDASGSSDPDASDQLTYAWTVQTKNPTTCPDITFSPNANVAKPTFAAQDDCVYTLQVAVTHGQVTSPATDTVQVTVQNANPQISQVANNGPINRGGSATITVTASDTAGARDPLSFQFDCNDDGTYEIGPQPANTGACTFSASGTFQVKVRVTDGDGGEATGLTQVTVVAPAAFVILDEDAIDNGNPPNNFAAPQVNDDIAQIGVRTQLRYFQQNTGRRIVLHCGQVGDEGWFAPKEIPTTWQGGFPAFVGNPSANPQSPPPHGVGPGLGAPGPGGDREAFLDKVPGVTPLRATALRNLVGREVCAVVYDGDVGMNYGPLNGSLKGANLGAVAFQVVSVKQLTGASSSALPEVTIEIRDAAQVCAGPLVLLTDTEAPRPRSSSEPFDIRP